MKLFFNSGGRSILERFSLNKLALRKVTSVVLAFLFIYQPMFQAATYAQAPSLSTATDSVALG
ncbi:MAG TPA: hypothetical protein VF829_00335 [Candidatus Paceibacterota bacterium]